MKNRLLLVMFSAAVVSAAACGFEHKGASPAGPSAFGMNAMLGNWSSSNIIPSPSSCTDFKWNVTEQTTTSMKGNFTATCGGDLHATGTAQGYLTSVGAINWSAQAVASATGLTSCNVTLTGTAQLLVDSIKVPYSGDTCLGKVSGTEVLKR